MKTQIIIMALILGLSACKKNENNSASDIHGANRVVLNSNGEKVTPANPDNPFDSIGYRHNVLLSDIQPCVPANDMPNVNEVIGCVIQFANAEHFKTSEASLSTIAQTVDDQKNNYVNILKSGQYSPTVQVAFGSLLNIVKACSLPNSIYSAVRTPIVTFETNIIKDPALTPGEKETLLKAASVARYSTFYWMNVNPQAQALRLRNIVKWVAGVTSDIAGALVSGNVQYAAGCSEYAYTLVNYSMP